MENTIEIATKETGGIIPSNITEIMQMSEMLSNSSIVPKQYQGKAGDIFVAIQWGLEIGMKPMQSLQSIATINGKPSLYGDAVLALVRGSGKLEYIDEMDDGNTAFCRVKRKGEPETARIFSMDDAKQAGLIGKQGPWSQYPKRMRQMRARALALRDVFTDVLSGMSIAEEIYDVEREPAKMPEIKQIPQEPEPLDKVVGNMLMEHCASDVAAMKLFVIESLEWPMDTELKGKWVQTLTEEELHIIKEKLEKVDG